MSQVLVDHQHPPQRPPQRDCPLSQPVQPHGLRVILHLSRDGLADWRPPPADHDARAGPCPQPALRAAWPQRSPCSPPFPPLTIAAHTIRSTSRPSRRPASTRLTSRNAAPALARLPRLPGQGARAHLQAPLDLPRPPRPAPHAAAGHPRPSAPRCANKSRSRWTWLIICAITQLRLARVQAGPLAAVGNGAAGQGASAHPGRVRRDFDRLLAVIGTSASPPKPCRAGRAGHRPAGRGGYSGSDTPALDINGPPGGRSRQTTSSGFHPDRAAQRSLAPA